MPEPAPQAIELLTIDAQTGRAIEGPSYPADCGSAIQWLDDEGERRMAHRHTFFARDQFGKPMPWTATAFYVREHMEHGDLPGPVALRAAGDRIEATHDLMGRPT